MRLKKMFGLSLAALTLCGTTHKADARKSPGFHYTHSYTRRDGTHVSGYTSGHGATLSRSRSSRSYGGGSSYSAPAALPSTDYSASAYQSAPVTSAPASYESTQSEYSQAETQPLPDTGGEPLLMMFGGSSLALGAFMLRRRIA